MTSPRAERGFTLIEVLVVLAVLALLGGLVLARGPQRSAALEMRQASSLVAGTLKLARSRAIASNRPVLVRFDPAAGALRLGADAPRRLPARVGLGEAGAIVFRPDGSSSGGRVVLTGEGRRAAIAVNALTGRVVRDDAG